MKNIKLIVTTFVLLNIFAFTRIQPTSWKVKEDAYTVTFKGTKVEGTMKGLQATIVFDEANPGSAKIHASLDVNTLNTGNGMKNKHAKSEEALNAKQFPHITFESVSVTGKNGSYVAQGNLTIKGITKEVKMPFTFVNKGSEAVFTGKLNIVSKDYNITKAGAPASFEVEITVPVIK